LIRTFASSVMKRQRGSSGMGVKGLVVESLRCFNRQGPGSTGCGGVRLPEKAGNPWGPGVLSFLVAIQVRLFACLKGRQMVDNLAFGAALKASSLSHGSQNAISAP
jgi:hypothetical protein